MSKEHAKVYRRLARGAEDIETRAAQQTEISGSNFGWDESPPCFTCNAIADTLGFKAKQDYKSAFAIEELDLWRQPDCPSIRVLLLCFAAAMAETGDL